MDGWRGMTAAELGRAIGAGKADPVDLAEGFIDAAKAHPMGTRIYARLTEARALAEAGAARARAKAGTRLGPLDGVPLSWKDLFDTAGTATEAGTRLLAGRVPDADATVLQTATANGLVCLGKTHMTEIAFSGLGVNPMTATPPNVHDPAMAPGGSSSGAAASVAFALAPAAIGSDTGGSIRLPSAWNDLVGFKPAHGGLPLTGVVPLCPSFDTVGPLVRSVEDAALLWQALGGPAVDLEGAGLAGRRLAVIGGLPGEGLESGPAAGLEVALGRLAAAGAEISHIELPFIAEAMDLAGVLFAPEAWAIWRGRIEADPEAIYARIRERTATGATVSAADHIAGWIRLRELRAAYAEALAGHDAAIWATVAIMPPVVQRLLDEPEHFVERNLMALRNTRIGNLFGLAGLQLPTGVPSCGVLLSALPGREAALLRLGVAAERALG